MIEKEGITVVFWASELGKEPVREWLKGLSKKDRQVIGEDIKTVQFGWPIGMPICRPLGDGLYELRSSLPAGRIARVMFCLHESKIVLLHGFLKKSQKTPKPDMDLAVNRKRQLE
ncbi:MAG: type II toxin-antitoxin system RelE/ParE family toxin [Candidatus Competibacteraceae bacterium]